MKFSIFIDYKIIEYSDKKINKTIKYEYHKHIDHYENGSLEKKIFCDTVEFTENRIIITGNRSKSIDLNNCWRTKKSNYKRCILSSLFYIYNFYKRPIKIESIKIADDCKNEQNIPFIQEFDNPLPDNFAVDIDKVEYLFNLISYKEMSELMFRVLHSQVLFTKNKDFYNAYRSFNSIYTFFKIYHDKLSKMKISEYKDLDVIKPLLKQENIEKCLTNSISLAENFVVNNKEELYRLILVWLMNEHISYRDQVATTLLYDYFKYKNINVLEVIKRLIETNYPNKNPKGDSALKSFNSFYKEKNHNYKINYLQVIVVYARYRRNKILHGEHVDSTFLIPDVNADILYKISEIIFQYSVDLVNFINKDDFSEGEIL